MSKTLHYFLFSLFLSVVITSSLSAQDKLWTDANNSAIRQTLAGRSSQSLPAGYKLVRLNRALAKQLQGQAPIENTNNRSAAMKAAVPFGIPLPDGTELASSFYESPILSRELQTQLGHVKTYELVGAKKNAMGRITITPEGITGLLFTDKGSVYISPVGKEYPDVHMVYSVKDLKMEVPMVCDVKDELDKNTGENARVNFGDCQLRTYRLAVAATGEYTEWAGSQANALTYITMSVNNVIAIYRKEVAITFTLVSNNSIIFADSLTDGWRPGDGPTGQVLFSTDSTITANLGTGGFDLGILFHSEYNGGLANLQSVCVNGFKGRAAAGFSFGLGLNPVQGPQGAIFDVTVAHEIAHQFGATHTFMATNGSCLGNPTPATAMEPGGGSTIMAYAGVCAPNAYQSQSDHYFHGVSLFQITNFAVNNTPCAVVSSSGNTAPDITTAPLTYNIPISTPFALTTTAIDADGNSLTYAWEQTDAGTPSTSPPVSTANTGPLFRSWPPSTNPTRYFPRLTDLISGAPTPYEVLPSEDRTMNFAITVRDNVATAGCTDFEEPVVVAHQIAGPFEVTSQAAPAVWTANGANTENITWSVNNTTAAPINCAAVDILLSVDGGYTYPYTLATATPNDGSHTITVPNIPTATGRIRVQASNNIFFNINAANITINSTCAATGVTVTPGDPVTAAAGNAALDLTLSPSFGTPVTISGTLASTDTYATGSWNYNTLGACIETGLDYIHDVFTFTVSVAGNYTFARQAGTPLTVVYNLYQNSFNTGNPCLDFLGSSITYDDDPGPPSAIGINPIFNLQPGIFYTMVVGTFSHTQPTLPQAYALNVIPPAGGGLVTGPTNPGAGFSYTYVVVSNATGNIVAIDPGADLSNSGTFPAGDYTIWGLSYSDAIAPGTLSSFIGGPLSALQDAALFQPGTVCSQFSQNSIAVAITGALPAELLPLKASQLNNSVQLKWGTVWEQNTSHFKVMRSSDGTHFETLVANVPAKGNSNSNVNYSAIDQNPLSGRNYYRLRQVDLDGNVTLSNVAVIDITLPLTLTAVYPNPAKSTLTLEYISEKGGAVNVAIIDGKGAVVLRTQFNAQTGRNIRNLQVAGLAKGIYALQITDSERTETKRFIKE